jgi:hypothetical protein
VTCHNCPQGYIGRNCEKCAPGYLGDPRQPGDTCTPEGEGQEGGGLLTGDGEDVDYVDSKILFLHFC